MLDNLIRQIIESRKFDAGGDHKAAVLAASRQIIEMMNPKVALRKIQPEEISVRDLLESFVLDPIRQSGGDVSALLSGSAQALAEAITTSQFPRLLGRMSEVTILDAYELALEGADELVTEQNNIRGNWAYYNRIGGAEQPELVHEGDAYEESSLSEFEVSIKLRKFGRILKLTKEMVLEDQTGKILDAARGYGQEMGIHRQTDILETVCGIASTIHEGTAVETFRVNGTGYALYSTDHSAIPGSGGYTNENAGVGTALATAGIAAANLALRKVVNIHGLKMRIRPTHLIVAPEQEVIANKLYVQPNEPVAVFAVDPNMYRGKYKPIVNPDGVDGTWYMGDFKRQARYCWGWKPSVETATPQEMSLMNDIVMLVKASYKGGCGNVDHRFAVRCVA